MACLEVEAGWHERGHTCPPSSWRMKIHPYSLFSKYFPEDRGKQHGCAVLSLGSAVMQTENKFSENLGRACKFSCGHLSTEVVGWGRGQGGLRLRSPCFRLSQLHLRSLLALALPLSPGFSGDLPPSEDLARGGQHQQQGIEDKGQGQVVSRLSILRACQFSASIRKSTYTDWTH